MDKGKIPSRRGDLADWYFHKLVPAIHKHKVAGKQIQLREAAYTLKAGLAVQPPDIVRVITKRQAIPGVYTS